MVKRQEMSDEVWDQNYRAPDENTLEDTWKRQAKACSDIEDVSIRQRVCEDFLWLLSDFKGIAGGRITANLGVSGRDATTLYNCFTFVPSDVPYKDSDSINGIYDMLKAQAQTLKSEGGYGTNFSWIRPAGSYVRGIGGRTPGVLKFMELWDKSSEIITMGHEETIGGKKKEEKNKIRKGAQMAILSCSHPEIYDFIDAKLTPGRLTKFNMSVGIIPGFVQSVIEDKDWVLRFPKTDCVEYKDQWFGDIEDWESKNLPVVVFKTVKAKDLWDKIMKATYTRNEPGVMFMDVANQYNPLWYAEKLQASNPCSEIIMSLGTCLLLSFNLVKYVVDNGNGFEFDFETFKKAVAIGTRFADNINDISRVPLPEYSVAVKQKRRIGMGVLGLGSMLYMLGIRYGSDASLELIKKIFQAKLETELLTSARLGAEKGSFLIFDKEKYFNSTWWNSLPISEEVRAEILSIGCMRNSHRSANAPTGNMSIYCGVVSGGIEPVFLKNYSRWSIVPESVRADLRSQGLLFPNVFKGEWGETPNFKLQKAGDEDVLVGTWKDINYMIDKNRGLTKETVVEDYGWAWVKENLSQEQIDAYEASGVYATTEDLSVDEHLRVLGTIAKYVDQSTSKTLNVPNDYPYELFKNIYVDAWKAGIKGITTYRAGTMTAVIEKVQDTKDSKGRPTKIVKSEAPKRPKDLVCDIHNAKISGKKWVILVGLLNGAPYEVFAGPADSISLRGAGTGILRRKGAGKYSLITENNPEIENIVEVFGDIDSAWATRMVSMPLRHGVPIEYICETLSKDGVVTDVNRVLSRTLKKYTSAEVDIDKDKKKRCKSCGSTNVNTIGCILCLDCGFYLCS